MTFNLRQTAHYKTPSTGECTSRIEIGKNKVQSRGGYRYKKAQTEIEVEDRGRIKVAVEIDKVEVAVAITLNEVEVEVGWR